MPFGTVTNSGTIQATTTSLISNTVILTGGLVQNSGAITNASHNAGSFVVQFGSDSGTVVNLSGALMSAYHIAIITGTVGGPSTVTNYGTIRSTGFGYTAVTLRDGGTVTNGTTPGSAALITGSNGIFITNAAGAVANFGTISATAGTALNFNNGGSVNNSGLITASATGVFFSGAGETVVNSGSIVGASAIILNSGGSINNSALINSTSGGVNINNAVGTLTNTGTITGTGDAVRLNAGGSVTNAVSGLIRGASGGVYAFLNPSTVTNFGTIQATSSFADSVYLAGGGIVNNAGRITAGYDGVDVRIAGTVNNSGLIQGGGSGNVAGVFMGFSYTPGSFRVNNTGAITSTAPGVIIEGSGAVSNGAGGATGASITGGTFGVTISGTGTVANYGTIIATGTAFADGVSVRSGTVINTGRITSVASGTGTVNGAGVFFSSGSVRNSGTINNPVANNGIGVQLFGSSGGTITNYGLISAYHDAVVFGVSGTNPGALTLVNTGIIQSTQPGPASITGFTALAVDAGPNAPVQITNTGTIQALETNGGGGAIGLSGGGLVTNGQKGSGAGLISGAFGVEMSNTAGTLVNFGSVLGTATGTVGDAVQFNAGGVVINYGFIAGGRLPTVTGGVTGYGAPVQIFEFAWDDRQSRQHHDDQ